MSRRMFATRVDDDTPAVVDAIAKEYGCYRVDKSGKIEGSTGVMLDKIAQGKLSIISNE